MRQVFNRRQKSLRGCTYISSFERTRQKSEKLAPRIPRPNRSWNAISRAGNGPGIDDHRVGGGQGHLRRFHASCGTLERSTNSQSLTRNLNNFHEGSTTYTNRSISLSGNRKAKAESRQPAAALHSFQQHAGDVVVLWRVADEEIEFGHKALKHFAGLN